MDPSPLGNRCSMFSHWKSVRSLGYRFRVVVVLIYARVATEEQPSKGGFLDGQ